MVWRGGARLTGVVRNERGTGVDSARVFVRGTNIAATSSDRGYFVLDSLPGGTHMLEVRALGYLPDDLHRAPRGRPAGANGGVHRRPAVTLETVRVQATLVFSRNLAKFQTNRERNLGGKFIGPREIDRYRGHAVLEPHPGHAGHPPELRRRILDPDGVHRAPTTGRAGASACPTFYIDGQRSQYTASEIEGLYRADEIAGVEVYVRERPASHRVPGLQLTVRRDRDLDSSRD